MPPVTMLLIDDLEDVRDVLAKVLSLQGYRVLTASNVSEAEAVRERVRLAALRVAITNVRLTRNPHAREGVDLIQRWHAIAPRLPFILMSGDLWPHEVAELAADVVWCLAKAFAIEAFLNEALCSPIPP
jgi:DNA-binding NtrC family response regulator